jgi:predicted methyltransferase
LRIILTELNKKTMNLKEKIKNYTTYIVDDRDNKWEVIELSDLQDLLDTDRAEQLILHGVVGQSEQLKCLCCDGKGIVEGEHYDDKQSCLTCNGRGYFN